MNVALIAIKSEKKLKNKYLEVNSLLLSLINKFRVAMYDFSIVLIWFCYT